MTPGYACTHIDEAAVVHEGFEVCALLRWQKRAERLALRLVGESVYDLAAQACGLQMMQQGLLDGGGAQLGKLDAGGRIERQQRKDVVYQRGVILRNHAACIARLVDYVRIPEAEAEVHRQLA